MQDTLFWHNSEVLLVRAPASPGEPACLVLSAAAVTRQLCPVCEAPPACQQALLSGFMKPLTVRFHGARLQGSPLPDCIGLIAEGELRVASPEGTQAGGLLRQLVLPWQQAGAVSLRLLWRNGSHLLIDADAAEAVPGPDARFIESYAC